MLSLEGVIETPACYAPPSKREKMTEAEGGQGLELILHEGMGEGCRRPKEIADEAEGGLVTSLSGGTSNRGF